MRRTFWVFHRSGTLQVSDSLLLSIDSTGGCSIPVEKLKWPHHLSVPWTTLHLCWKQVDNCHRLSVASHAHPMRARGAHSRGITDNCRGTSLAHCCLARVHSLRPLKRHCWYLPWHHSPLYCKESSPLVTPLKRQYCSLCGVPLILFLYLLGQSVHLCSTYMIILLVVVERFSVIYWGYIIYLICFVVSYNITFDHKSCFLIHHLVATHHASWECIDITWLIS